MNDSELKIANLWCEHGCPERMTLRTNAGEILLINGLPHVTERKIVKGRSRVTLTQKIGIAGKGLTGAKSALNGGAYTTLACNANSRVCEACGTFFLPRRKNGKFCTSRCRVAAQRKRTEAARAAQVDAVMKSAFAEDFAIPAGR